MEALLQLKFGLMAPPAELVGLGTSGVGQLGIGGIAGNHVERVLRSAAFHIDSHEGKASVD